MSVAHHGSGAGASQARLCRQAEAEAEEYARRFREARERSARHRVAAVTERRVADRFVAMSASGWHLLPDRRWPGTRAANVDMIHIGPGGVLVVDVKGWAEPRLAGGRLFRGRDDASHDVQSLMAVTRLVEAAVAGLGLAPLQVQPVIVLAGRAAGLKPASVGEVLVMGEGEVVSWAARRIERLSPSKVSAVAAELARCFPPHEVSAPRAVEEDAPPIVAAVPEPQGDEQLQLFDRDVYVKSLVEARLAEPIEEWMVFLHPDQMRVVRRASSGPARISGPPGTGKSVVALQRAAHLATTRPGTILVATYVSSLVNVQRTLYRRLSPRTAARVEFSTVHGRAKRLLEERGRRVNIDTKAVARCFQKAWADHGARSVLAGLSVPTSYWLEEINAVIKGRGLVSFDEYAALKRTGRGVSLGREQRAPMWDVYMAYQASLQVEGIHDFADVLSDALAEVRREPVEPRYTAVIVDEVQDLPMVGVQLMHALVGDQPDGLLLLGDSQQSIYPGGFTLAEAGISVAGRSTILRTNYRNCSEILTAAAQFADESSDFLDPEARADRDGREVSVLRAGGAVTRHTARSRRAHDAELIAAVRESMKTVPLGDCAVLTLTNGEAAAMQSLLATAGIPVLDLLKYDGEPSSALKVGTVKRAKGLEFKHVFLPHPVMRPPRQRPGEGDDAYGERRSLQRHEVYVAMTRARDRLWLGSC